MPAIRHRVAALLISMAATFVALRVVLHRMPDVDLNVGSYNLHHLFVGLLLVAAAGIPLVLGTGTGPAGVVLTGVFGAGLAMALDEWVYLIVTDGSNASYLLPASLWGGAAAVGLACAYASVIACRRRG